MMTTMIKPTYVLYYTENTPYKDEALECIKTLEAFGLRYRVAAVQNRGSWEKNTQIKAEVIASALKEIDGPVVYVDADARIKKYPTLLDNIECDIAFHFFRGIELLSGTLFFSNTTKGKQLVDEWVHLNNRHPGEWDQRTLQKIIESRTDIDWLLLPEPYVYIDRLATTPLAPVIYHRQASRSLKRTINDAK